MRSVPSPVPETSWVLIANGDHLAAGTASPGMERELAAGLLHADGCIRSREDLLSVTARPVSQATARLEARVDEACHAAGLDERRHRRETECDLLHFVVCDPDALRRTRTRAVPAREELAELLRGLFERCRAEHPGGGVHAAALAGPGAMFGAVDVGRHSAVAKAIGAALLAGATLPDLGLLTTSRISGRIAESAARAGVAWIASRSIPTTLAVAVASTAGLSIVARAASPDLHIFSSTARDGDA